MSFVSSIYRSWPPGANINPEKWQKNDKFLSELSALHVSRADHQTTRHQAIHQSKYINNHNEIQEMISMRSVQIRSISHGTSHSYKETNTSKQNRLPTMRHRQTAPPETLADRHQSPTRGSTLKSFWIKKSQEANAEEAFVRPIISTHTLYLRGSAFVSAAEPKVGWFSSPTKKKNSTIFPHFPIL